MDHGLAKAWLTSLGLTCGNAQLEQLHHWGCYGVRLGWSSLRLTWGKAWGINYTAGDGVGQGLSDSTTSPGLARGKAWFGLADQLPIWG